MPETLADVGLTSDGTASAVHGVGEPLVLIHGVGMQAGVWTPQIDALADTHQVIVYDMLGHGRSVLPREDPTLLDYANQLLGLLDFLGIEAANVAGHSMGALVALDFALRYPERCLRVAALNAVYQRSPEQSRAVLARAQGLTQGTSDATIQDTVARWMGDPPPEELKATANALIDYLRSANVEGYARTYKLFALSDRAHVGRLSALAMPSLFLTAEHDFNSTPAMSEAMASEVANAALVVVPSARHMVTVTHPVEVNTALAQWLHKPTA